MSEWLPELVTFYEVPVVIGCLYVIIFAILARAHASRTILAIITAVAVIAMITMARSLTGPTIYLGHVPGLQEGVGVLGIGAAAAVLFFRTRREGHVRSVFIDAAVGIITFLLVVLLPVGAFLLMASMNPD